MNKLIVLIHFILLSLGLNAQGESDWWYFGYHAGLHFVNDTVEVDYEGQSIGASHNSTQSDENGNLLFYSNGGAVYSNNHEVMENGEDPFAPVGLASISMKIGTNDSIYHLFYLGLNERIIYKTINIYSNNGLGTVSDPILLPDSANYHITATKQANGIDYWIVCRRVIGNTFISYSLTEEGLDLENPVYSQAGDDTNPVNGNWSDGHLRINAQGNLIAFSLADAIISTYAQGRCELFYFNKSTGKIEDRIIKMDDINIVSQFGYHFVPHSSEFSPDGEKLYFTGAWVFQCNIALLDSTSIIQSVIRYNDVDFSYSLTGLQLAKNGRAYISSVTTSWLSVIQHPNVAGLGAEFTFNSIDVAPSSSGRYLPNFDPSLFSSGFTVTNRCVNSETQFSLIYDMDYQYIHWDFGDGSTSTEWEPSHTYSTPGTYQVELTSVIGTDTLVKEMEVIIEGLPIVNLGLDGSLLCEGDSMLLDASFYAGYYAWQDGSYAPTYTVMQEGEYFVEVKNICGVASDTINIVLDKDELSIGEDTLICIEQPLVLLANQTTATSWLWQDGSTLPFYEAENEGDYFVLVNTPCYLLYDSIHVETENCGPIAPNIFTPNGDGVNDTFKIQNLNILGYTWSLNVYNRWGKQVFYSADYLNEWNGDQLSDGVYFYILQTKNSTLSYKGNVSITRK